MFFFDIDGRIDYFQIADSVTENLSLDIHSSLIDFDISCTALISFFAHTPFICCHRKTSSLEKQIKDLV